MAHALETLLEAADRLRTLPHDRASRAAGMLDILENITAGGRVLPVPHESMEQEPLP
jgi:hypothetical protein